jgi:hypothetical protein
MAEGDSDTTSSASSDHPCCNCLSSLVRSYERIWYEPACVPIITHLLTNCCGDPDDALRVLCAITYYGDGHAEPWNAGDDDAAPAWMHRLLTQPRGLERSATASNARAGDDDAAVAWMHRLLARRRHGLGLPFDEDAFAAIPTSSSWLVPTFCCQTETLLEMAILHASVGRRLEYVHALLSYGADPNAVGTYGTVEPLRLAAWSCAETTDRDDLIELLAANGARLQPIESYERDEAAERVRGVLARPSWSCPVCDKRAHGRCGADRGETMMIVNEPQLSEEDTWSDVRLEACAWRCGFATKRENDDK